MCCEVRVNALANECARWWFMCANPAVFLLRTNCELLITRLLLVCPFAVDSLLRVCRICVNCLVCVCYQFVVQCWSNDYRWLIVWRSIVNPLSSACQVLLFLFVFLFNCWQVRINWLSLEWELCVKWFVSCHSVFVKWLKSLNCVPTRC